MLFVGAFTERKGFPLLVHAWPLVRQTLPDARLQLVGKGPLQPLAEELAAADPSVTCTIDPPRATIKEVQARSQVLVLASQRSPTWRDRSDCPSSRASRTGARSSPPPRPAWPTGWSSTVTG